MLNTLDRLARGVAKKVQCLGFRDPGIATVRQLLSVAYYTSLKTEEGRFLRSSITYANPRKPEESPPFCRRADYPSFNKFKLRIPYATEELGKLSRAIDKWSASILVYGKAPRNIKIWGIVDQLVEQSIRHNREGRSGFSNPGLLTISVDGVGDLSVYHKSIFLGALRKDRLIEKEDDALQSDTLLNLIAPTFRRPAQAIARALKSDANPAEVLADLFQEWTTTVARLCIGLRRMGTGGAYLLTAKPKQSMISIGHEFRYTQMRDALVLGVLDKLYFYNVEDRLRDEVDADKIRARTSIEQMWAETDNEDRTSQLTGAIKVATSLATLDGLVLLTHDLEVLGFGTKLYSAALPLTVYDAWEFTRRGKKARKVDLSGFGMRHGSVLRYCRDDPTAVGVIVSQDGEVRIAASISGCVVLWEEVKLLGVENFSRAAVQDVLQMRQRRKRAKLKQTLGYTDMPKTMALLLK